MSSFGPSLQGKKGRPLICHLNRDTLVWNKCWIKWDVRTRGPDGDSGHPRQRPPVFMVHTMTNMLCELLERLFFF